MLKLDRFATAIQYLINMQFQPHTHTHIYILRQYQIPNKRSAVPSLAGAQIPIPPKIILKPYTLNILPNPKDRLSQFATAIPYLINLQFQPHTYIYYFSTKSQIPTVAERNEEEPKPHEYQSHMNTKAIWIPKPHNIQKWFRLLRQSECAQSPRQKKKPFKDGGRAQRRGAEATWLPKPLMHWVQIPIPPKIILKL